MRFFVLKEGRLGAWSGLVVPAEELTVLYPEPQNWVKTTFLKLYYLKIIFPGAGNSGRDDASGNTTEAKW